MIYLIIGPQGAGKTFYAKQLALKHNAVHLSIDQWMKSLYFSDLPDVMTFDWAVERIRRCEYVIKDLTLQMFKCDQAVVLDLGLLKVDDRTRIKDFMQSKNIEYELHYLNAPAEVRLERVLKRNRSRGETFAFEVTREHFEFIEGQFELPSDQEKLEMHTVNT